LRPLAFRLLDPKAFNAMDAKAALWEAGHFAKNRKGEQKDNRILARISFAAFGERA